MPDDTGTSIVAKTASGRSTRPTDGTPSTVPRQTASRTRANTFIGRKPIFVAGNSDGDYEMLRWSPQPRVTVSR